MIGERILIEKATTEMMNFLGKFGENRTIGSISRKEVRVIVKDIVKTQLKLLKKMGLDGSPR